MSIRIKKGFGFVANKKFITTCADALDSWCFNTDGEKSYFVGIILESCYSNELMPVGREDMDTIQKQYDTFIQESIKTIAGLEDWPDEKTRNSWVRKLKSHKPKLVIFVS